MDLEPCKVAGPSKEVVELYEEKDFSAPAENAD